MKILFFQPQVDESKVPGRDQELRTSALIRERPIRGESHLDFLGESELSLSPPHDSSPDAGEAMNDFWSMSGNFMYRHCKDHTSNDPFSRCATSNNCGYSLN